MINYSRDVVDILVVSFLIRKLEYPSATSRATRRHLKEERRRKKLIGILMEKCYEYARVPTVLLKLPRIYTETSNRCYSAPLIDSKNALV